MLILPPWSQGDMLLLDMPPGLYRLRDPALAGSEIALVVG
jgi:hypothetical protein